MAPGPTQKLTANYHLPRNVCVYKVDLGALAERTLPVVHTTHVCAQVQQSGRGRSIKPGLRSSATPPCADLSHLLCYVPRPYIPPKTTSWGTTPMHYLGYDFLFLWLEQPSPPTCRTLCLRKVGVGVQSCWFGHAPHTLSSQHTLLTKYILCMPQAWLQRYNYKLLFLSINMRQAQELIGHE